MATYLLLFLAACLYVHAVPTPPTTRNTIFIDEKLEGQIFEGIDDSDVALYNDPAKYRLPTTTRPRHYEVLWIFDMTNLRFSGTVSIYLSATQANVNEIVIHSNELQIVQVSLQQGNTAIPSTYVEDKELQFLRIRPATALQYSETTPVEYKLTIDFDAELRRDMNGIYRSWYRNTWNGELRWMATTQFQATHARAAFPCYDEPSFKATFDITIRRPSTYKSWSCTRIRETTTAVQNYQNDIYHTTPIMSTYLIALIVAEYETQDLVINGTLTYEVIARPGAIRANQSDYAFEVGQELLAEMSDHTGIDFYSVSPHIKMTQASIPDFSAGAMENWGLLTYREAYLMYDAEQTSDNMKQIIAYILSHEIAHMWFGNLVTCDWWDNLWLNEGFARYYQYYLTHWVEDYMGFDTRFVVEQVHTAMLADSQNNPHALYHPHVGDPDEVWAMFSTISYNKGACIIRMTEHLLGFEVHRQGLRNYLVNKSFQVALPTDLTEALHNASVAAGAIAQYGDDFSVVEYYKTWHDQPGVPVLFVQVNHQTGDMVITQRRFNINYGYAAVNFNWQIPITFASASNPNFNNTKPSHILTKTVTVVNRGSLGDEWVVFNKQQTGYYRVNYDDYTWDLIIIALRGAQRTTIHEYNRAQIVDDVFQFARSGLMSYTRAFNILSFLEQETAYAPWVAAMNGFSWLRNRLAGTDLLPNLESLITRWSTRVMSELTYYPVANETFMRSYLRRQLAPVLCNINVAACRTAATTQLNALLVNRIEVPVNSRNWVYCTGLRAGSYNDFAALWTRYLEHNVYTEKIQLLQTLGCTANVQALNQLLTSIVEENFEIRPQDYSTTFNAALTGNEANTQVVLEFVKNNLASVTQAFGSPSTPLSNIASRLRTVEEINSFQTWLRQSQVALGDAYTGIYNAAESTRESIAFVETIRNDINNYLVNGDEVIAASTPRPELVTDPVTVPRPEITEPVTPDIPDSAVTAVLSAFVLTLAVVTNLLM
ncbi:unnamed protein product [Colias eurytheme]|nr:unnamed protein product [Colias eurytheme]